MNTYHGLLWEQWHQSRLWIVGACAFLLMLTCGVALNHDWLMHEFRNDPFVLDRLAWIVGFITLGLLFINQRVHDVSVHFPRRQFTLPCRTFPLITSHLLFKSAIAVVLGGLISVYQWVLLGQDYPSVIPVVLFVALVSATQGLVMLSAVVGAGTAVFLGIAGGLLAMVLFYGLEDALRPLRDGAGFVTALIVSIAGWGLALSCGPATRHGRRQDTNGSPLLSFDGTTLSVRIPRPLVMHWDFTSPLWAQCWYEWCRVLRWTPRVAVPAALIYVFLEVAIGNYRNGPFILPYVQLAFLGLGVATVFVCSYFLLRISASEGRFLLAQPGAERSLVNGKLLAAAITSLVASTAATVILGVGMLTLAAFGEDDALRSAYLILPMWALGFCATLWVALTSSPFYVVFSVVGMISGLCFVTPWNLGLALGIHPYVMIVPYCLAVPALLYGLWRGLTKNNIPVPWELSLVLLVPVIEILIRALYLDLTSIAPLVASFDLRTAFLVPLFLLLGILLFARRLALISRERAFATFAGYLLAAAFVLAVVLEFPRSDAAELGFYALAACFAPVVWVPMAVRVQRYR